MVNPFRDDPRFRQVISPRDKARLYMMGALFVVVVGAFLASRFTSRPAEEGMDGAEAPARGGFGNADIAPVEDEFGNPVATWVPETPAERRDLVQDSLLQGFTKLVSEGKLVDSVPGDDPAVLRYVYGEAFKDYRVFAVPPAFYDKPDPAKILFEPGPFRGRFFSSFGRVVRLEPDKVVPEGPDGKPLTLHGVLFESDDGALVEAWGSFPIGREPGQWIQVYGIFYRLRPVEREGVKQDALCLFLVKAPETAYEPVVFDHIDLDWAKEVKERPFDLANNVDEPPLWRILNYAKNLGLAGYERLKAGPDFAIRDFGRFARELARRPDEFRFSFVSAIGRIIDVSVDYRHEDNVGKIDRVWLGSLYQPDNYFVYVMAPRPFSEWGVRDERPFVRVEGIFYKAWQFYPRRSSTPYVIPLVVVTGIYPVEEERGAGMTVLIVIVSVIGLSVIGLFVVMGLRDRQGLREFRGRYRERQEARVARRSTGGKPPGAEPPAGDGPAPPAAPPPAAGPPAGE